MSAFQVTRMVANLRLALKLTKAPIRTVKLSLLRGGGGVDSTSWSNLRSGVIFVPVLCFENRLQKGAGHDHRLILEPWLVLVSAYS